MPSVLTSRTELGTSKWQGSVMSVSEWAANKQSGRLGPVVVIHWVCPPLTKNEHNIVYTVRFEN
jgi:hypothetical protein